MNDTLEKKLTALPMELRQVIYVIYSRANNSGYMTHPDGKSVTFIIGEAIDRHPGTVYRYLKQLEDMGLISIGKHPLALRKGRSNGACVRLLNMNEYMHDYIIMLLITPPNAHFLQSRIDRLKSTSHQPT